MSTAAADPTLDVTGWTLGEKKVIKDAVATDEFKKAVASMSDLGFKLQVDTPSICKNLTDDNRKYPQMVYTKFGVEYAAELVKFCSNADYKEALGEACNTVVICMEKAPDSNGTRATYTLKDKTLRIILNGYFLCYSTDPSNLTKFLENSL